MAVSNADILGWLNANPDASPELINQTMADAGVSAAQYQDAISSTQASSQDPLVNLYQSILGRTPSQSEIDSWGFGSEIDSNELNRFLGDARNEAVSNMPQNTAAAKIAKQILDQGTINKWSGEGFGSSEKNAYDMATILASIGIKDIKDFGKVSQYADVTPQHLYNGATAIKNPDGSFKAQVFNGQYSEGEPVYEWTTVPSDQIETRYLMDDGSSEFMSPIDPSKVTTKDGKLVTKTGETYGNKLTGAVVPNTYSERQTGNFFGGTFAGKGNTGYGVQFDEQGNPYFYTQGASSSDIGKIAPLLTAASFIPGLAPFAQGINALIAAKSGNGLGALAGLAGLGGFSDVASAANFANAAKNKDILNLALSGANLGGVESIGDYTIPEISRAANATKAIVNKDPNALLNTIGNYASSSDSGQPIDTYPETTGSSVFADKPETSNITASTDNQSLMDILGDSSNKIISDAPFVSSPEVKATPDYSGQPFKNAFAAARANGDSVFNWNGNPYNTDLAPTVASQPSASSTPAVSDVYPDIRGTVADKAKAGAPTTSNVGPYVGYKSAFGMTPTMGDINQVADPRTLSFVKGLLGDDTSSKGFSVLHPDIEGIKSAGDVGTYSGFAAQLAPLLKPVTGGKSLFTTSSSLDPALEKFLQDSIIKDRVFHGTADDITAFSGQFNKATGPGVAGWVTPDASYASRYAAGRPYLEGAESGAMPAGQTFQEGANVIPMYASIKNPLNLDDPNVLKMLKEEIPFLRTPPEGQNWALTMPSQGNYVTDFARQKGYDALQVLDQGYMTYAPLSGTQLKSAISNSGAYNPKDARLGFAEGGVASDNIDDLLKIING